MSRWAVLKVYHPYWFGLFPIMFLYARNVTEMRLPEIVMPVALVTVTVAFVLLVLDAVVRSRFKTGLIVSLGLALFFSYGHLVELLIDTSHEIEPGSDSTALVIGLSLLAIMLILDWLILKATFDLSRLTQLLNQLMLALLLIQVGVAGFAMASQGGAVEIEDSAISTAVGAETRPDIYFIILDGYARSDILREIYDYDNSDFLRALSDRGFYIADSSLANYNSTAQSLTSALNLNYLHRVVAADQSEFSRMPTAVMLENNRVFNHLRKFGYQTVSFATGYAPTEIEDADYYFSPGWTPSEFQNHLLNSTPLPLFAGWFKSQFDFHRERLLFILEKLTDLREVPTPRFVFAHISCPHPPFVFGAQGEPVERDWPFSFSDGDHYLNGRGQLDFYRNGYRNQVAFISSRILLTIDSIIAGSERPPVILLQADHGPGSRLHWQSLDDTDLNERFSILNAYYLPGGDTTLLYETISPVNSFRVVMNQYIGTEYQMLPDRCYFTTWTRPYNYIDVTENLRWRYDD